MYINSTIHVIRKISVGPYTFIFQYLLLFIIMSQSTYCTVYRVVFFFIVFTLTGPHCKTVFY